MTRHASILVDRLALDGHFGSRRFVQAKMQAPKPRLARHASHQRRVCDISCCAAEASHLQLTEFHVHALSAQEKQSVRRNATATATVHDLVVRPRPRVNRGKSGRETLKRAEVGKADIEDPRLTQTMSARETAERQYEGITTHIWAMGITHSLDSSDSLHAVRAATVPLLFLSEA